VVSKGDEQLLRLGGRRAWHFPRDPSGYAGHDSADSAAAVAHLEELRGLGAGFLAIPRTAFRWLDSYDGLRRHLETHHRLVTHQRYICLLYALEDGEARARQVHVLRKCSPRGSSPHREEAH
jgi:hypothetical protein